MANLLQATDTLAQGYPKINASIHQSEQAVNISNGAVLTANGAVTTAGQAMANSQNTQQQLNTIVVAGDSGPEAAQARVNEFGVTFDVLKDRLDDSDSKIVEIPSKFIEKLQQIKSSVLYDSALKDIDLHYNLPNCKKAIQKGVLKIAIVGDSITEGANNYPKDVWANRLIEKIKKDFPGITIEYVNFSLGGRTLTQFMDDAYLATNPETNFTLNFWRNWSTAGKSWKDHVRDYEADLTIFAFGMNENKTTKTDYWFYTNLTNAISYVKTTNSNMDICLVSTILSTKDKTVYPQDEADTLLTARIAREYAINNGYALIDANRFWKILLYGVDECGFSSKELTTIETVNLEISYNFELSINFISETYPASASECDMVFRQYGTNLLLLRFRNDGTGNFVDLYSIGDGFSDLLHTWNGTQSFTIRADGASINIGGTIFYCYRDLYDGEIGLNKISSYINYIYFINRINFTEKPVYSELELLGAVTDPIGQGINGNGINHPTSLGHRLAYYIPSLPLTKNLIFSESETSNGLALQNSWVNFGDIYPDADYYLDGSGIVHLGGFIKSGTIALNTTIAVLPIGYRSLKYRYFTVACDSGFASLVITSSGEIQTITVPSNGWLSLDGISFKAEG